MIVGKVQRDAAGRVVRDRYGFPMLEQGGDDSETRRLVAALRDARPLGGQHVVVVSPIQEESA